MAALSRTSFSFVGRVPIWLFAVLFFFVLLFLAPAASVGDGRPAPDAEFEQPADLAALERAFQRIASHVAPSVVGIRVQRRYVATLPEGGDDAGLRRLEQFVTVNGSGTIIHADGLILTNEHVIQSASEIVVVFHDGRSLPATVRASDPRSDLAILQTSRRDLPPVRYADSQSVRRGQWSIAVGNPFGLGNDGTLSVSVGVISNLGRRLPGLGEVDDRLYTDMIQTTAAINPGNSGGPLFNIRGELVGVITAMHTRAAADEGVGFAIPLSAARRRTIDQLIEGHSIQYGYIGVIVRSPEDDERARAGIEGGTGVTVQRVERAGPAADEDLRAGDVILRFDEHEVRSPSHLAELVGGATVGERVVIRLWRDGRRQTANVLVERRNVSRVSWMRGEAILWRGLRLANLTGQSRDRMNVDRTATGVVVIDVIKNSSAERTKLKIGDLIEKVGGVPVGDVAEFRRQVHAESGAVALSIRDKGVRLVPP